jgi:predicted RecA/RadA family phage recombinase
MGSANVVSDGDSIDYTPSVNVDAGSVVVQNGLVGVAVRSISSGACGSLRVSGVVSFSKSTSESIPTGTLVYWNSTTSLATASASGSSTLIGRAVASASASDVAVVVRMLQTTMQIPAGIYGSSRAARFVADAKSASDSLDVVVIGDSNAGNPGNGGHTVGLSTALATLGVPTYATPMCFGANASGSNTRESGMWTPHVRHRWCGNGTPTAQSGTVTCLTTAAAASNADATGLQSALEYNTSLLPKVCAFEWNAAFVASGVSYSSFANTNSVELAASSPLACGSGGAGVSLQYRVVYGKFVTTGGKFRLRAMSGTNTQVAASASDIPTSGGYGYATGTLPFTSPASSGTPIDVKCSWDGWASGATWNVAGPFACLWHSIVKIAKGVCVSNFIYDGGKSTAQIADRVEAAGKILESYLKELRERQIAAGGSGRVLVWMNSGINGPDTSATWQAGAARVRDAIVAKWTALGFPQTDLAFVFSVTHPQVTGDIAAVRSDANTWASANANDGNNVTVVDLSAFYTASQLAALNLYDINSNAPYYAHLRTAPQRSANDAGYTGLYPTTFAFDLYSQNNGYAIIDTAVVSALAASA